MGLVNEITGIQCKLNTLFVYACKQYSQFSSINNSYLFYLSISIFFKKSQKDSETLEQFSISFSIYSGGLFGLSMKLAMLSFIGIITLGLSILLARIIFIQPMKYGDNDRILFLRMMKF